VKKLEECLEKLQTSAAQAEEAAKKNISSVTSSSSPVAAPSRETDNRKRHPSDDIKGAI